MIWDRDAALVHKLTRPPFDWYEEAAQDERLKLGKRHRKWLALRWHVQEGRPVSSYLQGAKSLGQKSAARMAQLGMIQCEELKGSHHFLRHVTVTRDGQAAVTWWQDTWAPMSCAPTWGLPILCAIRGNDRWPDRFYAMRAEKRQAEIVWITPNSGTSFLDNFTEGYWRAIP